MSRYRYQVYLEYPAGGSVTLDGFARLADAEVAVADLEAARRERVACGLPVSDGAYVIRPRVTGVSYDAADYCQRLRKSSPGRRAA